MKQNRNNLLVRSYLVWNTRRHGTRTNCVLFGRKNTLYQISFYPHERTVTPLYLSLSITDSVTSHCITLTLLGSTIKLQEPSQETRNWGLPSRTNPHWCATNKPQAPQITTTTEHKQLPGAKKLHNACCVETELVVLLILPLVITLIGDGRLHNVGIAPDDHPEVLTHEHIARWLCSAQDQLLCCDRLSHGLQL